ncbi:hypothetical protein LCGC14_1596500 [marine sediment metagenome]|uniref:Uncharacterized protein n=1 Tax=marine sediment metagenome TaxID=412755 RepID=A0A0F9KT18_9ZZZZ
MIKDDEVDVKRLKKILGNNIMMIIIVTVAILALFVGQQIGYRQGYTYVNDWYESYINESCYCSESRMTTNEYYAPFEINLTIT